MVLFAVPPDEMYMLPHELVVLFAVPPEEMYIDVPLLSVNPLLIIPLDMSYLAIATTFSDKFYTKISSHLIYHKFRFLQVTAVKNISFLYLLRLAVVVFTAL